MKVIISSYGPIFLNQTTKAIKEQIDVVFVQDSIPSDFQAKIINRLPWFKNFKPVTTAMKRREKDILPNLRSCGWIDTEEKILRAIFGRSDRLSNWAMCKFGRKSRKYIKDADIFHVRSGSGRGGAIDEARSKGMIVMCDHSIAHVNEMVEILKPEYDRYNKPFEYNPNLKFWQNVENDCKDADYVLVNSDYVKKTYIDAGYSPDKIKVLYLGVREDFIKPKLSYKIDGEINILFVGGFNFRKGCEYILKAFEILQRRNIPFKFTLIGTYTGFEQTLFSYNTDKFDFVGYVTYDRLKDYYQQADVFLFPSLLEGSTRAGMEAMAAGLPVVVTDNCGMPVQDRENGFIVPIKNETAIADCIEELYNSETIREYNGKNAYNTISNNYRWNNYSSNLIKLYEECLKVR